MAASLFEAVEGLKLTRIACQFNSKINYNLSFPSAISQPKAQNNLSLKSNGGPHRAAVFLSNDPLDATH